MREIKILIVEQWEDYYTLHGDGWSTGRKGDVTLKDLFNQFYETEQEMTVPPKQSKLKCDMVDTDLCKHYQKQKDCNYRKTHGVECYINEFEFSQPSEEPIGFCPKCGTKRLRYVYKDDEGAELLGVDCLMCNHNTLPRTKKTPNDDVNCKLWGKKK